MARQQTSFVPDMVLAWSIDDSDANRRSEHQQNLRTQLDFETVKNLTGILYWKVATVLQLISLLNYD